MKRLKIAPLFFAALFSLSAFADDFDIKDMSNKLSEAKYQIHRETGYWIEDITATQTREGVVINATWPNGEGTTLSLGEVNSENFSEITQQTIAILIAETEDRSIRWKRTRDLGIGSYTGANTRLMDLPASDETIAGAGLGVGHGLLYTAWIKLPAFGPRIDDLPSLRMLRVVLSSEGRVSPAPGQSMNVLKASAHLFESFGSEGTSLNIHGGGGALGLTGAIAQRSGTDAIRLTLDWLDVNAGLGIPLTRNVRLAIEAGLNTGFRLIGKQDGFYRGTGGDSALMFSRAKASIGLILGSRLYVGVGADGEMNKDTHDGHHTSVFGQLKWAVSDAVTVQSTLAKVFDDNDAMDIRPKGISEMNNFQIHF